MGIIGNAPSLTVGGRVFTDLTNLIVLHGYVDGATDAYSTMRKSNASAGYTPSGANKFRILAARFLVHNPGGNLYVSYTDDDVGVASASGGTNKVYPGGSDLLGNIAASAALTGDIKDVHETLLDFLVPNGKYPQVAGNGSTMVAKVEFYGYEEA